MSLKEALGKFAESLLFVVDRRQYWSPEQFGLKYEAFNVKLKSAEVLHGWAIPAQGKYADKQFGVVLYCHAMNHNMSYHLRQVLWLVNAGFDVVAFDYRGSGESEGESSLNTMPADVEAVFAWTKKHFSKKGIILFGQGPGAHAALPLALGKDPALKGIVLESLYANSHQWHIDRYGPGVGHLLSYLMPPTTIEPEAVLPKVQIPVALLIPELDDYIPKKQAEAAKALLPKTSEVWFATGKGYLGTFLTPNLRMGNFVDFARSALE